MNQYELAAVTAIVEALDLPVTVSSERINKYTTAGRYRITEVAFTHGEVSTKVIISVDTDGTIYHWPFYTEPEASEAPEAPEAQPVSAEELAALISSRL